jgi:uncharacterized protein (TIGR00661 family)
MRILYGVQGTGHGHLVRSREVVSELKARGHDVHCVLSARAMGSFPGMELFEPCTVFRGLTGFAARGRVQHLRTLAHVRLGQFFRDIRSFDASGFDLVLSDYEPVSAWIARRNRLPSIGIGHLYAFAGPQAFGAPLGAPLGARTLAARWLLRLTLPLWTPVRSTLGINWHPCGAAHLPPTIPADLVPDRQAEGDKILVYLNGMALDTLEQLVRAFEPIQFFVYGRSASAPDRHNTVRHNLHLRPYDRTGFLGDLFAASGVIANAGFSLISEALHLGKKVLVRPIRGQPEQYLNGKLLERLDLTTVTRELDHEVLATWLEKPAPAPMHYPQVVAPLVDWIEAGVWNNVETLSATLWSKVQWPYLNPLPTPV